MNKATLLIMAMVGAALSGCAVKQPMLCVPTEYQMVLNDGRSFVLPLMYCDTETNIGRRFLDQIKGGMHDRPTSPRQPDDDGGIKS